MTKVQYALFFEVIHPTLAAAQTRVLEEARRVYTLHSDDFNQLRDHIEAYDALADMKTAVFATVDD